MSENNRLRKTIKNQNENLRTIASMLQKLINDSEADLDSY